MDETLEIMMKTHFPCSSLNMNEDQNLRAAEFTGSENTRTEVQETMNEPTALKRTRKDAHKLANLIFTVKRVEWAIDSFGPFKSPGRDGIFPVLLQKGIETLTPILTDLFKSIFTFSYMPVTWWQVKVIFIPKANKKDKTSSKFFRPISLSSIMLKIMEKLIGEHIKSSYLIKNTLNKYQFAYQAGKSTVTARSFCRMELFGLRTDIPSLDCSKEV